MLTADEQALATEIGFDPNVLETAKAITGGALERLQAMDESWTEYDAEGFVAPVNGRDKHFDMQEELASQLKLLGYRAYATVLREPNGGRRSNAVAVVRDESDPFQFIRLMRTDGANYDVMPEDILARLEQWQSLCRFEVTGAAHDWVALCFDTLPENICEFAAEVYNFCPDTVEQGGLPEDDLEIVTAARQLCPELSRDVQMRLQDKASEREQTMQTAPEPLRSLYYQLKDTHETSADDGIKLLAYGLHQTQTLFLWWD